MELALILMWTFTVQLPNGDIAAPEDISHYNIIVDVYGQEWGPYHMDEARLEVAHANPDVCYKMRAHLHNGMIGAYSRYLCPGTK